MHRHRLGFTILELLVVIVMIGVLATLSTFGFSRFQASARDAQRDSQASVIVESLEKYYDKNGEYPSCASLTNTNAATVTTTTLTTIDPLILKAPSAASSVSNSIQCQAITPTSPTDFFSYVGDGSTSCATGTAGCLEYTLSYKEESSGIIKSISSRRVSSVAIPHGFEITVADATCSNINSLNLSWPAVPNTTNYTLKRSLSDDMSSPITTTITGTSTTVSGLTHGTDYYFQIVANGSNGTTSESPITYGTTKSISEPDWTTVRDTSTSTAALEWTVVPCAASYEIQLDTTASFSSPTTFTSTDNSETLSSLADDTTYYVKVRAILGAGVTPPYSDWSIIVGFNTAPDCNDVNNAPGNVKANTQGTSKIRVKWNSLSNAVQYKIRYAKNSNMNGASTKIVSGSNSDSTDIKGLSSGTKYWFDVQGLAEGSCKDGPRSSKASAATNPEKPTNVSITADRPGAKTSSSDGWMDTVTFNQGPGTYYYVVGKANGKCKGDATIFYHFRAEYSDNLINPPGPRYYENSTTGWAKRNAWYLISPNEGFAARFQASAGCKNNGVTSPTTSYIKACASAYGPANCSGWSGWRADSDWPNSAKPPFN